MENHLLLLQADTELVRAREILYIYVVHFNTAGINDSVPATSFDFTKRLIKLYTILLSRVHQSRALLLQQTQYLRCRLCSESHHAAFEQSVRDVELERADSNQLCSLTLGIYTTMPATPAVVTHLYAVNRAELHSLEWLVTVKRL